MRIARFMRCRAGTAALVACLAAGCSPYLYEEEIAVFREGVDRTVASFEALKQAERERRVALRDDALKAAHAPALVTDGCEALRLKYEEGFGAEARNVLTEADYQACAVEPAGGPSIDPFLPNLSAIGHGLVAYADGLDAVTDAEDAPALQTAFTEFNASTKELLKAVNRELEAKQAEQFDAVAGLVYRAGVLYLDQRRFSALKRGVNQAHPVVAKAAQLLAEAAFDIHGPAISAHQQRLADLEDATDGKSGDTYLAAWRELQDGTGAYIDLFRNSPVRAFDQLVEAHEALRRSLNDAGSQEQIDHVLTQAKAFRDSATAALALFKDEAGEDGRGTP